MAEINITILEKYMSAFKEHVEIHSDGNFDSFKDNPYLYEEEGYKADLQFVESSLIRRMKWEDEHIGTGVISSHMVKAVQNCVNLIDHHQITHFKNMVARDTKMADRILYDIYKGKDANASFENAVDFFGAKYDLMAYLFFLKDDTRFLPVRPTLFDAIFKQIGIDFTLSHKCSWENYREFTGIVADIREKMEGYFGFHIRLIDAYSFLWMIPQLEMKKEFDEDIETEKVKESEGKTKVRIGQSEYRANLIKFWDGKCSVTECKKKELLIASHIKPWKDCSKNNEWLNVYNGLLLIPNLDSVFDLGYISFDETGKIMISKELSTDDCLKLNITKNMKLRKMNEKINEFLEYHRKHIFKN